jgi:hypothetical protein
MKPQFELFVNLAREQAKRHESRNQANIRLFLFAIEIGLRRKLTPEERTAYEKTFLTAYILCGVALGETPPSSFDRIAIQCVLDWLKWEPHLKAEFEQTLGHSLDKPYRSQAMSPEMQQMVVDGLAVLYDGEASKEEIAVFLDRLEHPLDRA